MNTSISAPLLQPAGPTPQVVPPGDSAQAAPRGDFSAVLSRELPGESRLSHKAPAASSPENAEAPPAEAETAHPEKPKAEPGSHGKASGTAARNEDARKTADRIGDARETAGNVEDADDSGAPGEDAGDKAEDSEDKAEGEAPRSAAPAVTLPSPSLQDSEAITAKAGVAENAERQELLNAASALPFPGQGPVAGNDSTDSAALTNEPPHKGEDGKALPPGGNDGPLHRSPAPDFLSARNSPQSASPDADKTAAAGEADAPPLPGLSALTEALLDAGSAAPPRAFGQQAPAGDLLRSLTQANAAPQFPLHAHAGGGEWNAELGNRIRWLAGMKISSAELQLHPAELGALEVRIMAEDDRTTVSFSAHNPAARDLIEASLPRLRDLLAGSGLQLTHSEVSQQGARDGQGAFSRALQRSSVFGVGRTEEGHESPLPRSSSGLSLVDHYV